jgi:hypothetical protein
MKNKHVISEHTTLQAQFKVSKKMGSDGWMPWVKRGPDGHPKSPSKWTLFQWRDAIEFWDADHRQEWRIIQIHTITERTIVWEQPA